MATLPTTVSSTDEGLKRGAGKQRSARSLHAESEKILQIVFRVARLGPEAPRRSTTHHYYRAILRGSGGSFHLAGSYAAQGRGSEHGQNTDSAPPLWIERRCGLRSALHAVNRFVPEHQGPEALVTYRIHKGARTCRLLWKWMVHRGR